MGYFGERPPTPGETPRGLETSETDPPAVPESEIRLDFVRSSGPGGQKVNKTSSKAQLRWSVCGSQAFTEAQKAAIRESAGHRLNNEDEIVLAAETERSQSQNRDEVIRRLQELVAGALAPRNERQPTKVSRSQKQRRLEDKSRTADKKRDRKLSSGDW
jgi:ribosome-associated protein